MKHVLQCMPGSCGFVTDVTATADDDQMVQFTVTSPCANLQGLAAALPPRVDAYQELGAGYEGELWTAVRGALRGCCGEIPHDPPAGVSDHTHRPRSLPTPPMLYCTVSYGKYNGRLHA